jgi:hypothetical protein
MGKHLDVDRWQKRRDIYPVQVTLLRAYFYGEASGVTGSIGRARLAPNGGETNGGACLGAYLYACQRVDLGTKKGCTFLKRAAQVRSVIS